MKSVWSHETGRRKKIKLRWFSRCFVLLTQSVHLKKLIIKKKFKKNFKKLKT